MVLLGVGGICVFLWGRIVPRYLCPVFFVINLKMLPEVYGKIHAVIRQTSEFGYVLLRSLAEGWESTPLYRSGQVHPDISTMTDKGVCFIDYFPLYGLFWGLFSTIKHLPVDGVHCLLFVPNFYYIWDSCPFISDRCYK